MRPQYSRYYTYIKPVLQNKYVKTYSSSVFSIITILVFSIFAIKPTISTIVSLQKSIDEHNLTLTKIKAKQGTLNDLKSNYSNITSDTLGNIEMLAPYQTALPDLVESLEQLVKVYQASSTGVQIQPVEIIGDPELLIREPKIEMIEVTINIKGTYFQLSEILDKLSSSKRLVKIKSVDLIKNSDQPDLSMSINAIAFYLKN